jgi:hypothetical protein
LLTPRDGRLEQPDGRSAAFGEVLQSAGLPTLDVMGEWEPGSGIGAAAGAERCYPVNPTSA